MERTGTLQFTAWLRARAAPLLLTTVALTGCAGGDRSPRLENVMETMVDRMEDVVAFVVVTLLTLVFAIVVAALVQSGFMHDDMKQAERMSLEHERNVMKTVLKAASLCMLWVVLTALWSTGFTHILSAVDVSAPAPEPALLVARRPAPEPVAPAAPRPASEPALRAAPRPACTLDGWRWRTSSRILTVEGTTSCATGRISIRLFDGDTFLGVATAYIKGYSFSALAFDVRAPRRLSIRYTIAR